MARKNPSSKKPRRALFTKVDEKLHKQRVGERLRVAREAKNLTQMEFAKALDWTNDKINHYEGGRNYPPPILISRLWARFRISADWIYNEDVAGLPHDLAENLLAAAKASRADAAEAVPPADGDGSKSSLPP